MTDLLNIADIVAAELNVQLRPPPDDPDAVHGYGHCPLPEPRRERVEASSAPTARPPEARTAAPITAAAASSRPELGRNRAPVSPSPASDPASRRPPEAAVSTVASAQVPVTVASQDPGLFGPLTESELAAAEREVEEFLRLGG